MRLTYRPAENTLRLTLDIEQGRSVARLDLPGYVDVGEGGRLVGVEVLPAEGVDLGQVLAGWVADPVARDYVAVDDGSAYVTLSVPVDGDGREEARAARATLAAELDESRRLVALSIPRRGAGYEISYPSGNQ